MLTLAFYPVDTWFFRESRPMDSIGGTSLGNQFPPSAATLMGALRTRIGDMLGADWGNLASLPSWWGNAEHWGDLTLEGPWIRVQQQDYLPCPAHLLRHSQSDGQGYTMLRPGGIVHCDLGKIRLPELPDGVSPGVKPLHDHWLPTSAFSQVLSGQVPSGKSKPISSAEVLTDEYRLGIALDPKSRSAMDGQLYQTRHLRPRETLAVVVKLHGLPKEQEQALECSLAAQPLVRLGGEGRMAEVRVVTAPATITMGSAPKHAKLLAISLTPMPVDVENWPLPGFAKRRENDQDFWCGELAGYPLKLISMTSAKIQRQGGWNLNTHQPRPMQNYLPAGTVFFFDDAPLPNETRSLTLELAGQQVLLALGWWQDKQTNSHKE